MEQRKNICLMLCLMFIFMSLPVLAFANTTYETVPFSKYLPRMACQLKIEKGTATCALIVEQTNQNIDEIEASVALQKKKWGKWKEVDSWTVREEVDGYFKFSESCKVGRGMYRMKGNVKVYKDGTKLDSESFVSDVVNY